MIDFGFNRLGAAGATVVAGHPATAGHTALFLRGNQIGRAGVDALAASPHLGRVVGCNLEANGLGDWGAISFSRSKVLRPRGLDLSTTGLTDTGVEALAASPAVERMMSLWLEANQIGDPRRPCPEPVPRPAPPAVPQPGVQRAHQHWGQGTPRRASAVSFNS